MTETAGSQDRGELMPRSGVRGFSPSALRQVRAAAHLSPDELARLIGATRQAVGTWERGDSKPSPVMLLALSNALGVPAADLAPVREADLRLGDLRAYAGLTQGAVAKHVATSTTAISDIERGFRPVVDELVAPLAALYGVTQDRVRSVWQQTYDAITTRLSARK